MASVVHSGPSRLAHGASLWVAAALVPAMLLEMMLPIESTTSIKLALVFLALSVVAGTGLRLSLNLVAHLSVFAVFILLGIQPVGFVSDSIVRTDTLNAIAALSVAPFVAARLGDGAALRLFVRRSSALMVTGGMLGASLGAAKLYLLTKGVFFESLYAADGSYPLGTALGSDYNIYAFGLVAGVAAALWLREDGVRDRVGSALLGASIVIMSAAAAMTGSRRGMLFLLIVLAVPLAPNLVFGLRRAWRPPLLPLMIVTTVVAGLVVFATRGDEIEVTIGGQPVNLAFAERVARMSSGSALVSTRAPLIEFAWQRLDGGYSASELLRGRGFSYLADMGRQFAAADGTEYPHNFVLSALLHGGVPFTLALIGLVGAGIWVAVRRRATLGPYPMLIGLALIFALTSSASLYSTEVLVYLLVLVPLLPAAPSNAHTPTSVQ